MHVHGHAWPCAWTSGRFEANSASACLRQFTPRKSYKQIETQKDAFYTCVFVSVCVRYPRVLQAMAAGHG